MYTLEIKKRVNSRKYSPVKQFETEQEVLEYINRVGLKYAGTPYIFTHINLSDGSIIAQNYNGIMCSPIKLRDALIGVNV